MKKYIFILTSIFVILFSSNCFAANIGDVLLTPETSWTRINDADSSISYINGNYYSWQYNPSSSGFYNNDYHYTYRSGDAAQLNRTSKVNYSFTGSKIRIIGMLSAVGSDECFIKIDGVQYLFSQKGTTSIKGVLNYESPNLTYGVHNVELSCYQNNTNSNGLILDAIDICNDSVTLTGITSDITNDSLSINDTSQITVTAHYSDNTTQNVTNLAQYNPSNNNISVVNGLVTALSAGTCTINITYNEYSTTQNVEVVGNNKAILLITMANGTQKEYDLTMTDVNTFLTWFDTRASGTGTTTAYYAINKSYNIGPFLSRKDYVVFDKIQDFEICEYNQ